MLKTLPYKLLAKVDYIAKNDLEKIISPAVAMRQRE